MEAPTRKKKKRLWNLLFLLLMVGATVYIVFRDRSLTDIWDDIMSVNPFWFGLAAGASLFSSLMLGFALHISLKSLCGRRTSFGRSMGYSLIGSYYSAITPSATGGQPLQLYYMVGDGIDVSYASLALLLVNVAYQLVVLLFPAVMLIFRFRLIADNLHGFVWLLIFGAMVSIVWILFLSIAMFYPPFARRVCHWVLSLLHKLKIVKDKEKAVVSVDRHLDTYRDGATIFLSHPWMLVKVFLIYVLQMGALFSISYFVYRAYGLNAYSIFDFLALQSVLYLAVCFLPVPGAAGATEGAFLSLYQVVFPSALIVSAMLLSRLVSFYLILMISGVVSFIIQLRRGKASP